MIPLIVGAIAGALAMRTLPRNLPRTVSTASVGTVKAKLREASICGLANLEHSSAKLRQHLAETQEQVAPVAAVADPASDPQPAQRESEA
ncbi:hypothetical protein [Aeromonas tecta]|uniref:hypothetical protein n=1 Tax=Aeromonas tecta TaxID=324617 RepID=UPI00068182DD|nr:hypothetical protein [Aeromonas tecta]